MFDVGFSELILLAIVALVVLGPEKLPHAARVAGAWLGRIRRTVSNMQAEIEREVSAQELKARMEKEFGSSGISNTGSNFLGQVQQEVTAIKDEINATENMISPSLNAAGMSTAAVLLDVPADVTPTNAVDTPPPPALPDVAKPLDSINMDGEAAYRQWLESQKRRNAPVTISSPDDSSNNPSDNPSGQTPA